MRNKNLSIKELNLAINMKPLIIKGFDDFKSFNKALRIASVEDKFIDDFNYEHIGFDLKIGDSIQFNNYEYIVDKIQMDEKNEHVAAIKIVCLCPCENINK